MTDDKNSLPYRPNVCMIVVRSDHKIFIGERATSPGVWQLPQGGVEPHLSEEENVYKELEEELGAPKALFAILKKLTATHTYDFRSPPAYAVGKWRGQSQTFWLVRYSGTDNDINLARYHPEFQSYAWVTIEELKTKVEPLRLPGYLPALEEVQRG